MEKVIELIDAKNKTKKPKKPKIQKPRIGGKVPKNWIYCPAIGQPIDIFVPFKVPLHKQSFDRGIRTKHSQLSPDGHRELVNFGLENLPDYEKENNLKVNFMNALTFETVFNIIQAKPQRCPRTNLFPKNLFIF